MVNPIPTDGIGLTRPRSRAGNIANDKTLAVEMVREVRRMSVCDSPKFVANKAIMPKTALMTTEAKKTVRISLRRVI